MTRDIEGVLLQKRAEKSKNMSDAELIDEAKGIFKRRKFVWIGGLQMELQLPFSRAYYILGELIKNGFAIPKYSGEPLCTSWVAGNLKSSKVKKLRKANS